MQLRILMTHPPEILSQYFGAEPLEAISRAGIVTLSRRGRTVRADELIEAGRGQDVIVLDRTTAGPAELFRSLPI